MDVFSSIGQPRKNRPSGTLQPVELNRKMARPEGFEPPTAWFVVSKLFANFLFLIVITGMPVAHFA